mmetsp:Transcript_45725/g.99287  ORF Transcript_45725/g.99287 Transcript_45725/m.99287 type:complete len:450 (-) Transcript_45725:988-2337(-)
MYVLLHKLVSQLKVIVQGVRLASKIGDISRVRHCCLDDAPCLANSLNAQPQIIHVVQRIKDSKDIHTTFDCLIAKFVDGVVRVGSVPDPVRSTEQHLKKHIGHQLAQFLEALPRRLAQKAVRNVECGSSPVLARKQVVLEVRSLRRDVCHVNCSHPGREQTLMGVSHRCVRQHEALVVQYSLGDRRGSSMLQNLFEALRRCRPTVGLERLRRSHPRASCGGRRHFIQARHGRWDRRLPGWSHFRIHKAGHRTVNNYLSEVLAKILSGNVKAVILQEIRIVINDLGIALPRHHFRVVQQILQERDVRGHPTNPHLAQSAAGPLASLLVSRCLHRQLHQQRVVMRCDSCSRSCHRPIDPDSHPESWSKIVNSTRRRGEVFLRILCGNPTLNARSLDVNVLLVQTEIVQVGTLSYAKLRLHKVHPGHLFCDRVLHLKTGIHLNEEMVALLVY